jgi:hypothetical protein
MIAVVINFSGNVGKSIVAGQMIGPRLNAQVIAVESVNSGPENDGIEAEKIRGKEFSEINESIIVNDDLVIDVGASNVEEFLKQMNKYKGSQNDIDRFIIPTVKSRKQLADTINTIRYLAGMGINKDKIRLVFNQVDTDDDIFHDFAPIFGFKKIDDSFILNTEATIFYNEIFDRIKNMKKSVSDISNDNTNYREKLKNEKDPEERSRIAGMIIAKQLASQAVDNMNNVFDIIMK